MHNQFLEFMCMAATNLKPGNVALGEHAEVIWMCSDKVWDKDPLGGSFNKHGGISKE
jgi:hypothetical protein